MVKKFIVLCLLSCLNCFCMEELESDVKALTKKLEAIGSPRAPHEETTHGAIKFDDKKDRQKFLLEYGVENYLHYSLPDSEFINFIPLTFTSGARKTVPIKDFPYIESYLFPEKTEGARIFKKGLQAGEHTQEEFDVLIRKIREEAKERYEDIAKKLSQEYKIHLMPQDDDQMVYCLNKLLTAWKNELQSALNEMKVMYWDIKVSEKEKSAGNIFPRIVLYPADGKQNAQRALNIIFSILSDIDGANICPRYNAKVTSLIYVAQGDGDFKESPENYFGGNIYEEPQRIYYDLSKIPPENGHDHYLKHPGTGKLLTK